MLTDGVRALLPDLPHSRMAGLSAGIDIATRSDRRLSKSSLGVKDRNSDQMMSTGLGLEP